MQMLGEWFTGGAGVGLKPEDEPEKARKLRKTLALFLQVNAPDLRRCDMCTLL